MLRANVIRHQLDGCGEKRRIISEAQHRQKVRDGIDGQHEIGKRADQRCLNRRWRLAVEGTIVGGQQLLSEGNRRNDALQLAPELTPQRVILAPFECSLCR